MMSVGQLPGWIATVKMSLAAYSTFVSVLNFNRALVETCYA